MWSVAVTSWLSCPEGLRRRGRRRSHCHGHAAHVAAAAPRGSEDEEDEEVHDASPGRPASLAAGARQCAWGPVCVRYVRVRFGATCREEWPASRGRPVPSRRACGDARDAGWPRPGQGWRWPALPSCRAEESGWPGAGGLMRSAWSLRRQRWMGFLSCAQARQA